MSGNLISRRKLLADMDMVAASGSPYLADDLFDAVKAAPAEDAKIVRHARWDIIRYPSSGRVAHRCVICGCEPPRRPGQTGPYAYCPDCGAKMDAKEEPHENQ